MFVRVLNIREGTKNERGSNCLKEIREREREREKERKRNCWIKEKESKEGKTIFHLFFLLYDRTFSLLR